MRCRHSLKPGGTYMSTDFGFMWHLPIFVLWTRWIGDKRAILGIARYAKADVLMLSELVERGAQQAEDLAATMLASTLGLDFDPDAAWNERRQIYEHSSLIIDSTSITATAECGPDNHWTCAIAAAVFLFS